MSVPSDRLFSRLFSCADHPIFVLDPASHRMRYANRCACLLLGYAGDELRDMPASVIFGPERGALEAFLEPTRKHDDAWTTAFALRTKTGGRLPAELLAFPFQSDEHRYVLVLANTRSQ